MRSVTKKAAPIKARAFTAPVPASPRVKPGAIKSVGHKRHVKVPASPRAKSSPIAGKAHGLSMSSPVTGLARRVGKR